MTKYKIIAHNSEYPYTNLEDVEVSVSANNEEEAVSRAKELIEKDNYTIIEIIDK